MYKLEPIIISNNLPSGSAFAVRKNGGSPVYIPADINDGEANPGDEVWAVLVPNEKQNPAHRAIFLDWNGQIQNDPSRFELIELRNPPSNVTSILDSTSIELRDAVRKTIHDSPRMARTCREIAEAISGSTATEEELERVQVNLTLLHKDALVVRASIEVNPGVPLILWAKDLDGLGKGISRRDTFVSGA